MHEPKEGHKEKQEPEAFFSLPRVTAIHNVQRDKLIEHTLQVDGKEIQE